MALKTRYAIAGGPALGVGDLLIGTAELDAVEPARLI